MSRRFPVRAASMKAIGAVAVLLVRALTASGPGVAAADPQPEVRRVAIVGDSITENGLYSRYVEAYLVACCPETKAVVFQFGWKGEKAGGFEPRMERDMLWFEPDVVLLCFGMNDGRYAALTPEVERQYAEPMQRIVSALKARGTELVIGGPGAVDTRYFRSPHGRTVTADVYNGTLGRFSAIASELAVASGGKYADLHRVMVEAMTRAKQARGMDYEVYGRDGVHPSANGHLVMAYAFLKAMGVSGDIGTIRVAMNDGDADATAGHKVLSTAGGSVELESVRYPFCFAGKPSDPTGAVGMLPFIPFNQELNRLVLKVDGLTWDRAKVTWGTASRVFSRADLEAGVNLAAEFVEGNPFSKPFAQVQSAIASKQQFETFLVKNWITRVPALAKSLGDDTADNEKLRHITAELVAVWEALRAAAVAAVVPVRHTIVIEQAETEEVGKKS